MQSHCNHGPLFYILNEKAMSDPKQTEINNEIPITSVNEIFRESNLEASNVEEQEEDDLMDLNENYNSNDDYGRSGEKYGWYNGFSDDAIDDAFEGDPDATWNVD